MASRCANKSQAPGKPHVWSDRQTYYPGTVNMDLSPDGKRFVILDRPEAPEGANNSVHVIILESFAADSTRRIPTGDK